METIKLLEKDFMCMYFETREAVIYRDSLSTREVGVKSTSEQGHISGMM